MKWNEIVILWTTRVLLMKCSIMDKNIIFKWQAKRLVRNIQRRKKQTVKATLYKKVSCVLFSGNKSSHIKFNRVAYVCEWLREHESKCAQWSCVYAVSKCHTEQNQKKTQAAKHRQRKKSEVSTLMRSGLTFRQF